MGEVLVGGSEYRFGGHQTFPVRIAWLPKAAAAIRRGGEPLSDTAVGVVELGLGKNMVEALRCWVEAYGVATRSNGAWALTAEGDAVFGEDGFDPFLEDAQTLWWLHWTISSRPHARFFAWELMINRWTSPTFTAAEVVDAFLAEVARSGRALSLVSARQHFDVWLHTYLPGRSGRGEDGLDGPLTALAMITRAGERETAQGRREQVYSFDLGRKRSLSDGMFRYALAAWWEASRPGEETAPFREVAFGVGSPGQVFRLSESEVRERLEALQGRPGSGFEFRESLNQYVVHRRARPGVAELLADVYAPNPAGHPLHA